jgi:hypothetical protein
VPCAESGISHLMPARQHQTVVGMAFMGEEEGSAAALAELMKQSSFLLDEAEPPRPREPAAQKQKLSKNGRISHITLTSSISNASSSSSSSSSLLTGSSGGGAGQSSGSQDASVKTPRCRFCET